MTLLGLPHWDVREGEGPKYKVGPRCSNPSCDRWAEHAHHIVRKSHLSGREERNWIVFQGETIANLCGLCAHCHRDVTGFEGAGHRAAIFLITRTWWWCVPAPDGELPTLKGDVRLRPVAPLDPHPPTLEEAEHPPHSVSESGVCPTCGQARRQRAGAASPRRRRTWVVNVPDDEQETGADILDTLVDDLALVLGYDPGPSARYYVIVPALVSAQVNRQRFVNELRGVGG